MRDGLAHVSVYTDDTDDDDNDDNDDDTNLFTYMEQIKFQISYKHYLIKHFFLLASKYILKKVTAFFYHYF